MPTERELENTRRQNAESKRRLMTKHYDFVEGIALGRIDPNQNIHVIRGMCAMLLSEWHLSQCPRAPEDKN